MLPKEQLVDKEYENLSWKTIAASPIRAIQGISKDGAQQFADVFSIRTIGQLAEFEFFFKSKSALHYASSSDWSSLQKTVNAGISGLSVEAAAELPVESLVNMPSHGPEAIKSCIKCTTIGALASSKYIERAIYIVKMAENENTHQTPAAEREKISSPISFPAWARAGTIFTNQVTWIFLGAIIVALSILFLISRCAEPENQKTALVRPNLENNLETRKAKTALLEKIEAGSDGYIIHKVIWGDKFWDLSERYYGTTWYWPIIYYANRHLVDQPDLILPLTVINIPRLLKTMKSENINDTPRDFKPILSECYQEGALSFDNAGLKQRAYWCRNLAAKLTK